MEYIRILNWAEVAAIYDQEDGTNLPDSQKNNRLVLVAILTEIRTLLEQFADINGRFFQLRPDVEPAAEQVAAEVELVKEFQSLTLSYEKKKRSRTHVRGTNHLIAVGRDMGAIMKNPRRLQWVAASEQDFIKLLGRLTQLNDYLHELLQEQKARELEDITRQSYLELLQVRGTVEELVQLVNASKYDIAVDGSSVTAARMRNNSILKTLAEYKRINVASDIPAQEQPPDYESVMGMTRLDHSTVEYSPKEQPFEPKSPLIHRNDGKLSQDPKQSVWIEWKPYTFVIDPVTRKGKPFEDNVKRVRELVALLQRPHPKEFIIPQCLGYFDDREDTENSNHDSRFGLVYSKPEDVEIISLRELIETLPIPSLSIRVRFAHKITTCVLYLHAVNWLHKALRSDNVVFSSRNNTPDFDSLLISGFEYARPDRDDAVTRFWTSTDQQDFWWDMYRWPEYQGIGPKPNYRKTFDIYSLGILLLEIANWRTVENIMKISDPNQAPADVIQEIRGNLLTEPDYLHHVRANLGDKYHDALRSCLEGRDAFDIDERENEMSAETGAKLQQGFFAKVVTPLAGITT